MDFLAVRFTVATVVMFALRPTCLRRMTLQGLQRGAGLGAVLGAGYITQTYGLRFASATVSGFITGMFVVLTPVISWLILGKKLNRNTILAVVLATVGLALLSLHGWSLGIGELLTLACAIFFAVHIVGLGMVGTIRGIRICADTDCDSSSNHTAGGAAGRAQITAGCRYLGNGWNHRSFRDRAGFPGTNVDTIAGACSRCSRHHDDGTGICRHLRGIFREKPSDTPDYFRRGVRADGDVSGGNQIISEGPQAGKLSGSIY